MGVLQEVTLPAFEALSAGAAGGKGSSKHDSDSCLPVRQSPPDGAQPCIHKSDQPAARSHSLAARPFGSSKLEQHSVWLLPLVVKRRADLAAVSCGRAPSGPVAGTLQLGAPRSVAASKLSFGACRPAS